MSQKNKSVLLNTSAGSDVQYSGGEVLIAGLDPIKQNEIVNISQVNYRAEVAQVVAIGATAYVPVADTTYAVEIGDVTRVDHGYTENLKKYSYTTPAVISTLGATAADQREAIHLAIIAKINAIASNFVVAATLTGGNGFTVTDDAGDFPYNKQGMTNRKGASLVRPVKNLAGTGFAASNYVLTTPAVYEFGTGLNLLNNAPVYDFMTGNLIAGEIETPVTIAGATAVSGQKYNMFSISYLKRVALPTAFNGNSYVYLLLTQQVFVDNGAGSSTSNLAGYIAFERAMHRVIANKYKQDPNALVEFFDSNFVIQGPLGAVPLTTANLKNKFLTGYGNMFNHYNIGTQTIVAPTQGAAGLLIEQDTTATEGAHYCAEVVGVSPKDFVVGKTDITFLFKASATTVANMVLIAGLRTQEAYAADFNDYTNLVALGSNAGDFFSYGILANAATVATDSTLNAANSTEFTFKIIVNKAGLCSVYVNDVKVNVYSSGTIPLVFTAGTVLIPFFQYTNLNSAAAVPNVTELLALADANVLS